MWFKKKPADEEAPVQTQKKARITNPREPDIDLYLEEGQYTISRGSVLRNPVAFIRVKDKSYGIGFVHAQSVSQARGGHAFLMVGQHETYIEDNNSTLGTYLDGDQLEPEKQYQVTQGNHNIKFGDLELKLEVF